MPLGGEAEEMHLEIWTQLKGTIGNEMIDRERSY